MKIIDFIWSLCVRFVDPPSQFPLHLPNDVGKLASHGPVAASSITPIVTHLKHTLPVCNTASNRQTWDCPESSSVYSINTDYEDVTLVPDTGVARKYTLVLTNGKWTGDGYLAQTMLFNNTYPGPLLEANWGDTFEITVINNLTNENGTAIHWHGIRQWNSVWADGVPGVTQCPIPPRGKMTYKFKATQYGTSWYHSHFSLQYGDGLTGPMIIHGPTSMNYDEDLGEFMMADWYHDSAFSVNYRSAPPPLAKLINGKGNFDRALDFNWENNTFNSVEHACDPVTDIRCYPYDRGFYSKTVKPGKKYKLHIINASVDTHFSFWLEMFEFWVVATDFVPVTPYKVEHVLNIGIGQRYDIIIITKEKKYLPDKKLDFWVNMRSCDRVCIGNPCPWANDTGTVANCYKSSNWAECRQGALRFEGSINPLPLNSDPKVKDPGSYGCQDERLQDLRPIVPKVIPDGILPDVSKMEMINLTSYYERDTYGNQFFHWALQEQSFKLNWTSPSISLINQSLTLPPPYAPIYLNKTNDWVFFYINANFTPSDGNGNKIKDPSRTPAAPAGGRHPIHLHGHDFLILAQIETPMSLADLQKTITGNLKKFGPAPRRDTALLPQSGALVIGWKTDNPGPWLMHCHIAWHVSNGFALQFVERPDDIVPMMKKENTWNEYANRCNDWGYFASHTWTESDDSGV